MRKFEIISKYPNAILPIRKTSKSAGYDICAYEDITILPGTASVVNTGIKAAMLDDEYLAIHIRSSLAIKQGLMLVNSTGIIDADYYNNPDNEGHIMIALFNTTYELKHIKAGERIAQGIFTKYYKVDGDCASEERTGGIGSTNEITGLSV